MDKDVRNLYEMIPRRRREFRELGDGTVEILMPRYGENAFARVLKTVLNNKPVRVQLDDVGACVWRLCDGKRTVLDIGEALHEEYGDRIEPLYDRLHQFLEQMRRSEMIEWVN
jgi:hypothetical protein